MVEWLRKSIGRAELAGMFRRGEDVVFCPSIGEDGYTALTADDRDDDGPAQVRPMSHLQVASFVQLHFWCHKIGRDKDGKPLPPVPAMFPVAATRPAVDHPHLHPNLRHLRGVTHSPLPRRDGTILDVPGYDDETRLLYLPSAGLTIDAIPASPTAADAQQALKQLRYVLADFRFLTVHDEANMLGLMLTPLLRELAPAPYKLAAIGAPQPGSGKSLLAEILRILHGGVFRSEVPNDDTEMRKVVTTILDVTTGPVVQLDNVSGVLRSSVLSGLLTSRTWEDRRLGSNSQMRGRNDRLWVITGNNLTLGGDLVRRTVWVTIDPAVPDPHLRTEFAIPDLAQYVREHRGELLHALLVLIRRWVVLGSPVQQRRGSDSYGAWIETVSGILATAEHPGVFDHRESARQSIGQDDDDWREFLESVHTEMGDATWSVKDLLGKFTAQAGGTNDWGHPTQVSPALALDVLPAELAEKASRSHAGVGMIGKSLGRWLANRDGRWAGDLTVRRTGGDRNGARWQVQRIDSGNGESR